MPQSLSESGRLFRSYFYDATFFFKASPRRELMICNLCKDRAEMTNQVTDSRDIGRFNNVSEKGDE